MGSFFRNTGYYLREVATVLRLGGVSSVLSVVSLAMIFLMLLLALSAWQVSGATVEALGREAEVSVYGIAALDDAGLSRLIGRIETVPGVTGVTKVTEVEAYDQMAGILGPEAEVLTFFEENPFDAYLAVGVALGQVEPVAEAIRQLEGVDFVRDNLTILKKLERLSGIIAAAGLATAAAVGTAAFIITAHIIREGVHSHRDQIATLKLLGAPDGFINAPFILEGCLLTVLAGLLAEGIFLLMVQRFGQMGEGVLQFLPALDTKTLLLQNLGAVLAFALTMGAAASFFGLRMVRE